MVLIIRATGGAKRKRTPARSPSGEPQPKPGTPSQPGRMKSQGETASRKAVFPYFSDSIETAFHIHTGILTSIGARVGQVIWHFLTVWS